MSSGQRREESSRPTLLVVGNGMVAHRLRTRLAMSGTRYDLVVLGEEPRPAYDRVHLTDCLMGRSADELELQAPNGLELPVELHLGDAVVSIERSSQLVRTASGREFAYDRLVLATGSRAARPPIPGIEHPNVFTYRTVEDLDCIRARAQHSPTAVVLGGGLLGLEAARALADLGPKVHVVELAPHLLHLQLDELGSAALRKRVEACGIHVHLARRTRAIAHDQGGKLQLEFEDGGTLTADMVLVAVGIVPNDELAHSCGLSCAPGGGIEVDGSMRTSDPLISAVGECASVHGRTFGLVAPGFEMVETLLDDLAGRSARFRVPEHATRLKLVMADVGTVGDALGEGQGVRVVRWKLGDNYRKLVMRGRELVGAAAVGRWQELERVQEAIRERRSLWPWELLRFRHRGMIWSPENQHNAEDLPERATICSCLGVTRGELSRALQAGAMDVTALTRATGAGSVCGSCQPTLLQLVDPDARFVAPPLSHALLVLSVIATLATVLFATVAFGSMGALASTSWREPRSLEFLWRSSAWQEVSGYVILALLGVSLTLILRKRWRGFLIGSRTKWRILHAAAALTSLGVLALHTGLDAGGNLLAVLSACTLAAFVSGGLLGLLFAFRKIPAGSLAWHLRRILWWVHIALLWPLPVLCFFHVLAVYRF